ncbi:MAG: bifunctional [glutamate--ammonia ligase]-adenylyl-L-tyrosine phosphorylase/[glutamate--ammonia-ligase] adenylyltransferase [Pirellulales bacterium]|nr:bifunctional [glutamate--ammonia ligase]-adenylyl-L-tyrosine phosphorylase/[glutamate--ammonia-ligase] adenylyltransferase [Pirellulales bacterium]
MKIETLRGYLDNAATATEWLQGMGLVDTRRAHGNLVEMALSGITMDLMIEICKQLEVHLPACPDPDMALNNLERYIAAARNSLGLGAFFKRDHSALPTLIQIFSNSQHLSNQLVTDPESFDLLWLTKGKPMVRHAMVENLTAEVDALDSDEAILAALRRYKYRQTLRIAYGDIVLEHGLRTVTRQISFLADAILEAALRAADHKLQEKHGIPRKVDGSPANLFVLGMGKLGGIELNYSSDIDLIMIYDEDGNTDGRHTIPNSDYFSRLARECVRFLSEGTDLGSAYRVDLRLRPDGQRGPIVSSMAGAMQYYDLRGRTWERQAYIKARPVAGDRSAGGKFLRNLRPWIYRRYLSRADISGIKALKRKIERRTQREGVDYRDVKTGHGGIRDIEFVIQFLQLLNGADLPAVQTGNTIEAIAQLENVGCLSNLERTLLEDNYSFLREIEHRLQIMFDLQTHLLPESPEEVRKLALRMGYGDGPGEISANIALMSDNRPSDHRPDNRAKETAQDIKTPKKRKDSTTDARQAFEHDYRQRTVVNRRILDHLLHDAFVDDAETEAEADLVLDPDPPESRIVEVMGRYPFKDIGQAYRNLMSLGEENIRFLSTRRCRHFLAAIAPELLKAIAATPDPDSTLVNLGQVSDSLGGKGVLWELFSFNPPSLRLYVELCAYSPYLSEILTNNAGMADGLMDSLVLDKLPDSKSLRTGLAALCHAAEDLAPILHSFKNDQQLRVGVRDILGKEDIRATTIALSAIAEACLEQVADQHYRYLLTKLGQPTLNLKSSAQKASKGRRKDGKSCGVAIIAMGKFGGREMNYHSDLDVIFIYEDEGNTVATDPARRDRTTSNQDFFSQWGQRIIKTISQLGPYGKLYEIDARLRPAGKSGPLAVSAIEFARYFSEGDGQLWERQALCKARIVYATPSIIKATTQLLAKAAFDHRWNRDDADEIRAMRKRLEDAAEPASIKRGPGGIVDIEFLVQMMQLAHARRNSKIRTPNTLEGLELLAEAQLLSPEDANFFIEAYRFLRTLESRLRLISTTASDKLPENPTQLAKLAHLMQSPDGKTLEADCHRYREEIRRRFDRIFDEAGK